jgi:aconitase A
VKPEHFRQVYEPMFAIHADNGEKVSAAVRLAAAIDLHPPPALLGRRGSARCRPRTLKGMRPLALLPDNITTDHLSPSNAIMLDSAAGEYLHRWACRKKTSTRTPRTAATT